MVRTSAFSRVPKANHQEGGEGVEDELALDSPPHEEVIAEAHLSAAACVLVAVLAGRGCMQATDGHISDSEGGTSSEAFVDPSVSNSEFTGARVTQEPLEHSRVEGDAAAAQAAMLPGI